MALEKVAIPSRVVAVEGTPGIERELHRRGLCPPFAHLLYEPEGDCEVYIGTVNPCFTEDESWP